MPDFPRKHETLVVITLENTRLIFPSCWIQCIVVPSFLRAIALLWAIKQQFCCVQVSAEVGPVLFQNKKKN